MLECSTSCASKLSCHDNQCSELQLIHSDFNQCDAVIDVDQSYFAPPTTTGAEMKVGRQGVEINIRSELIGEFVY